ncbi:hypothetical protein QTP70_024746 [Hemibagrus guttatus]|uniref:WW domain-binding protein 4 n=1 Tax=Hemibagrus guttatus TaxID=175788 RepID=A0AAE0RKN1_9TELE|nr:hypothetical protein QTP70_024746 [Hemibagrus guttatus]KAK3575025.1 hypothetical protein QTP86_019794 [Hemibagrus guttatus]
MADYWKSQPKKFCQYCKCWIADNKPSIEFHERGKNHKQNVAAKIEEIKKNSTEKAKKVQKMSKEFAAMEEAAKKAYEEDMKRLKAEAETPVQAQAKDQISEVRDTAKPDRKSESNNWVQGTTDNGQIYYYNTTTGESTWEKPSVSSIKWGSPTETNVELVSQPESHSGKEAPNTIQVHASKISFRKRKEEITDPPAYDVKELQKDVTEKDGGAVESSVPAEKNKPPAKKNKKANPYGDWEQIQEDEDPFENLDLQLPQKESGGSTSTSSNVPPEPKTKFKERTITSLGEESSLGAIFKKKKTDNGKPRRLRQRGKED